MTISFHASGTLAGETEGALGMRWTLNCGGLVTRTMKGTPDEWNYLDPFDVNNFIENPPGDGNNGINFDLLYNACTDGKIHGLSSTNIQGTQHVKLYDSEFDIFNYSLPNGKSGHFILKGAPGSKIAMTIPYDPIKIEFVKSQTENGYIESLTITDVDGTKYKFGKIDGATGNAVESNIEWDIVDNRLGNVSTAWYLSKIISSDATDEISLFYNTRLMEYYAPTQTATIRDRLRQFDMNMWTNTSLDPYILNLKSDLVSWHFDQTDVLNESLHKNNVPVLSSIQFHNGSASLNYTSSNLLSNIIINRGSVPYKKVLFNLATQTGGSMHYLNNISFYGEDQATLAEKYDFSYYDGTTLSVAESAVTKDWWGYMAGAGRQGLILKQTAPIVSIPLGTSFTQVLGFEWVNRDANESARIGGMLKAITYPTGGQTEFVYENNKYGYALDGPGLRIKEVISTPVKGKVVHKEYKYGINEDGKGFINDYLRPGSTSFTELKVMESNTMHFWTMNGDGSGQEGKDEAGYRSRRYLADPYISFDLSGNNIKYDAVTEYVYESDGESFGLTVPRQKMQTLYSWGDDVDVTTFNITDRDEVLYFPRKFSNPENAWLTPVMTGKTFYKYDNGQFAPIKTETYTYSALEKDHAWDLPTYLHTSIGYGITGTGYSGYGGGSLDNYLTAKAYDEQHCSIYGWGKRKYTTGSQVLINTTIEEYTPAGTIVTQKNMDYNDDNLLRSEMITNSKNEVVTTTYSYPKDFAAVSPYNEMVNRNLISPVIEQVQTNTTLNKQLARTKTNYNLWQANTLILPATMQKSLLGNALETEVTINEYDNKGNILQVTGKDGIITSYIWGYDQKYPVAKIVGRSYGDAVTQSYIDLAIINNGTLPDGTIRAELNKLRTLSNCFISTYTYKPFTGMTSETDPAGRTIYYEYDVAGRLALTRDKDNNILKKYVYDYQGLCTTCGAMTSANWHTTGNTRHLPCQANFAYNGLYGQKEEKDLNPASSTYNQSRWIDYLIPWNDPLYDVSLYTTYEEGWVNTSTIPRCIQNNGQNTGEQEHEQVYKAANPCSISQNSLRWKNTGMNTNACPLPPLFTSHDLSGTYYSSVCTSPAEPDPIYVTVPLFTSTISVLDADIQAREWAQSYADQHGNCTVPPVTVSFFNYHGGGVRVTLYDVNTGQDYTLSSVNGADAYLQNVPQGSYNVYIEPANYDEWMYYQVGCDDYIETKGDFSLYEIQINANCNTITVH
ncbi:hypothetical protein A3860_13115 [Niastella vici]|uniref:DUF5977 domain-containing protein n=1 Tax=Niastella vici TaxID=1703345 RepID=A0A1V9G7H7_9BACT|nr:RHS repeat domain-containing protein [Niastella vici]OQP66426.1 hypothetical protein A3860_13115 [Niastella vici]